MDSAYAVVLGIVEGITEFLPISSTGHLILSEHLLGLSGDFWKSFEIVIQLGAIAAAALLYLRSFFDLAILKRIVVAFVPTGVIGLALYHLVKTYLLGSETVVLCSLFLGGIALIAFELWHAPKADALADIRTLSYPRAFLIGCFQAIAIVPGVSRSAATIVGGLLLNVERRTIVEFSFLLAVPTMAAATGLDLLKSYSSFSAHDALTLLIGFVVSFVVAIFAIRFLLSYIKTHTFIPFGIYRILLAIAFFLLLVR